MDVQTGRGPAALRQLFLIPSGQNRWLNDSRLLTYRRVSCIASRRLWRLTEGTQEGTAHVVEKVYSLAKFSIMPLK